jgi:F-type H+-transporting ATPase subunit epsilon
MRLEIVSAEKNIYSDEVSAVVAPSIEGEIAILDNHAPLLTSLQPGEVRIIKNSDEDTFLYLSGGFIEVLGNHVTILADAAERVEEIEESKVQEAIQQAEEQLNTGQSGIDLANTLASMRKDQIRLKIVQRRKSSNRTPYNS